MIIDRICDRRDGVAYNPRDFYYYLMESSDYYSQSISAALDGGENSDVQKALCEYIRENNYNLDLCDYVNKVDWINADKIFQYVEILQVRYAIILKNLSSKVCNGNNWQRKLNSYIRAFAKVLKETDKDFADIDERKIAAAINEAICIL